MKKIIWIFGVVLVATVVWQWRYIVHAPVWVARAWHKDKSDLYDGRTNGIPNRDLVLEARSFFTQINQLDKSGNITSPEPLRLLNVHLDNTWFQHHAPESVDFNPFDAPGGDYVITWRYVPGCQKAIWKSSRPTADWYDMKGDPCYGICLVSIVMTSDHRLSTFKVHPLLTS